MTPRPITRGRRRGGVLFEVLLSIALFVGAASFAMAAARSALAALERARRQSFAIDLARSKMAELEAGLTTLADLRDATGAFDRVGSIDVLVDETGRSRDGDAPRWSIDVEIERTEFTGLTLVALTVREERGDVGALDDADGAASAYTLRQLVRLSDELDEGYETDELLEGLPGAGAAAPGRRGGGR